jgi:hypothetical protein
MKSIFALIGICLLVLSVLTGCAATKQVAVKEDPAICAFLGTETCGHLTAGGKGQAGLRWINPDARLTQYNKLIIEAIGFFGSDAAQVPRHQQQVLTDYFYDALTSKLTEIYPIADRPGPEVLRIQVAILDAEAATPGLRTVSIVIPQIKLIGAAASVLREGKFPFAGSIQVAVKLTDSVTGEVLGAAVDRRVGGGSIKAAAQWEWGDAENAIDAWAKLSAERLHAYTSGAKKP